MEEQKKAKEIASKYKVGDRLQFYTLRIIGEKDIGEVIGIFEYKEEPMYQLKPDNMSVKFDCIVRSESEIIKKY